MACNYRFITVSVQVVFSFLYSFTKATFFGFQQVELPSHLQNSEQASYAAEQLHICQEHGMSLLQLQLINLSISERAAVTLVSGGYWPPFTQTDFIIPQQVLALADVWCKTINVICDDT